ncbi:MCE family protein [Amycolatopsis sp. NPDC049691]|uniref:MCE family protein n=1 Tax=Amycolatopsis sp. NPDC049691 TaxID=3155155 RepID=UPI0034407E53
MRGLVTPIVKLIVFFAVTIVATAALAFAISNSTLGSKSDYAAVFSDVTALNAGDDIRIAGVKVGEVDSIEFAERQQAKVSFTVDSGIPLPASVTAVIRYRNLVNQRFIELDGQPQPGGPALPKGATIPLERTKPALNLTVLFNGFQPLFQGLQPAEVNQLTGEIIQVLQGEGGSIDELLQHTGSLTTSVAEKDRAIGQVITNLNTVLDEVNGHDGQLSSLISTLQQLVSGLAADRKPIGDAIGGLGGLADTVQSLLADGREPLRQDIAGLGSLAKGLDDSSATIQHFLDFYPKKAATITRAASYGSWFAFYLCNLNGTVGALGVSQNIPVIPVPASQEPARCK